MSKRCEAQLELQNLNLMNDQRIGICKDDYEGYQ